jgi:hypothetical protein
MSQNYTIKALGDKALWDGETSKGDYPATLAEFDEEVLVFHDSTSNFDPPKVGDVMFGDPQKDKRGRWRFKRKARPKGASGNSQGGGFGPEDIARITRSHSQEMALRFFAVKQASGGLPADFNLGHVRDCASWFDRDVQAAVPPAPSNGTPQMEAEVPADMEGLVPSDVAEAVAAAKSDDDIPF